tara:strand:+ start:1468 stop:1818 length:351 start_codon:yes stop_codon:yes gene_type:complete
MENFNKKVSERIGNIKAMLGTLDAVKKHLEETKLFLSELYLDEDDKVAGKIDVKEIKESLEDAYEFLESIKSSADEVSYSIDNSRDEVDGVRYSCDDMSVALDRIKDKIEGISNKK